MLRSYCSKNRITPLWAGLPAELAPIYVLLASEDTSYMTGSTVQVTGGYPTI